MISIEPHGNALELHVLGKVDRHDMIAARRAIDEAVDLYGAVPLLLWLDRFEGYATPAAFFDDLRLMHEHRDHISKLAVVGDAGWLDPLLRLGSKLAPEIEVRRFEAEDRDLARRWVEGALSARSAALGHR